MTDEPRTVTRRKIRGHILDGRGHQFGPPWTVNWISWRSSRANVDRRLLRGERPVTCEACGCEVDVVPVPHSPRCKP